LSSLSVHSQFQSYLSSLSVHHQGPQQLATLGIRLAKYHTHTKDKSR
jgi:hypothetical protein